ncbi:MAG: mandelate racemase/muconate lactonizing enzyme family protein [Pseudonocardia sp.]
MESHLLERSTPTSPTPAGSVRIARIEVTVLGIDLARPRTISKGVSPSGESIRPVLVRIESTDGAVGYGQDRPVIPWLGETTASIVSAVRHHYGPALLGADAAQRAHLARRLPEVLPGNSIARNILDMALHDLVGRSYGVPVHALLGGSRREIPLNWSVSLGPPAEMVQDAVTATQRYGLRLVCLKSGGPDRWRTDVETFRAVRVAVGPDVEIAMDPNEGYDVATTLRVARALADDHVHYFEQPLVRSDLHGSRIVRGEGVPVMVDEGAITPDAVGRLVAAGACDGIVLKLWKSGGYAEALECATLADRAGLDTTLGGVVVGSVLGAAASAHLYSAAPRPPLGAEFVLGLNVTEQDPVCALPDDLVPRDGVVRAPAAPGLGVEVDKAAVERLAVATVDVR